MTFHLKLTSVAKQTLNYLEQQNPKKYKKVRKALGLMEINLYHPSLKTHKYESLKGPNQEDIFEAYIENKTPGAWRAFWYYGVGQNIITIFAIEKHPD